MRAKKFRPHQPDQIMLLPPSLNDWLPSDHEVYFVRDIVESMDLSAIYASYRDPRGQPPYEPLMMVQILIYGYMRGIRSSRKLERALYEDVGFRVLSGNQQPDHWTISEFRRRHHEPLGDLLAQTVQMAERMGLVDLQHASVDGTKVKANASRHSAMSYGRMKTEEERLRNEIQEYFEEMETSDREEDAKYGEDRRGDELPEHMNSRRKRLEAIQRAKEKLEQEAEERAEREAEQRKEKAESEGRTYRPRKEQRRTVPRDKDQRNFTDPESRIMLSSEGAFIQAYNAQSVVDSDSMIVLSSDLTNQAADSPHFIGLLQQSEETLQKRPEEVSADAAYYNDKHLMWLEELETEAFIPPDKVRHNEWRNMLYPRGRIPKDADRKYLMRRKLRTKRGRERYKKRQCSVEPVFGYIKEAMGFRQLLLRGEAKARSMWKFACAAYNLWKIFRAGKPLPGTAGT